MIPCYVLRWRTAAMPAPAFWYFSTRRQAERAESLMEFGTDCEIIAALVTSMQSANIDTAMIMDEGSCGLLTKRAEPRP